MKKGIAALACFISFVSIASAEYKTFTHDKHTYQVFYGNDMRTWTEAYSFAAGSSIGNARGYLANVNSSHENVAILKMIKGIFASKGYLNGKGSAARDGGGASYAWLGGNDIATEGEFYWASSTNMSAVKFWTGGRGGKAVGSAYTNWGAGKFGREPDNYNSAQDAVAMAAEHWPLGGGIGSAGQWNDINQKNVIAFVIEYDILLEKNSPDTAECVTTTCRDLPAAGDRETFSAQESRTAAISQMPLLSLFCRPMRVYSECGYDASKRGWKARCFCPPRDGLFHRML